MRTSIPAVAGTLLLLLAGTASGNDTGLDATGEARRGTYGNNNVNMNTTANLSGTFPAVQQ